MEPHQLARMIQDECDKIGADYGRIYSLIRELQDLVGLEEADRLLRQPQPPIHTIN